MDSNMPGKFQAIVILHLVTGILGAIGQLTLILATCGFALLAIVPVYGIIVSIMAIVSGSKGMGNEPRHTMYKTVGIMQIIAIVCGDVFAMVSGILTLVFLEDPEVQAYMGGATPPPAAMPPTAPTPPTPPQ